MVGIGFQLRLNGNTLRVEEYYIYPWGNGLDGSKANYGGSGDPYEPGNKPQTTPVGYYDGG